MDDKFFKSDLEKEIWISVYTRHEPDCRKTQKRMEAATALVIELREELGKLLAIGKWTIAAGEASGLLEPTDDKGVFRSDVERKIWVSAFTRATPKHETARDRAKRAWELVLEFRQPQKLDEDLWNLALAEMAGG